MHALVNHLIICVLWSTQKDYLGSIIRVSIFALLSFIYHFYFAGRLPI